MTNAEYLLIASLACWRVTEFLQSEAGPFRLAERLRSMAGTGAFACFLCLSVWVAAPIAALGPGNWWPKLLLWPAISAGAVLLQRLIFPASLDSAPEFHED